MAFEELGPTFVKFGQLLASRPDFIPDEYIEEFKRLHDQVGTIDSTEIESVLVEHFKRPLREVFRSFDSNPLAAASIAQVHRAVLMDGAEVVVKVQRPGIARIIREDLNVLYTIAGLLEKYVPESRVLQPKILVDEFFKILELETNFIVEANNITRFERMFASEPQVRIPKVHKNLSGLNVLVMDLMPGIPLSNPLALEQPQVDPQRVADVGLRAYFNMVYRQGFFHGDLHAGNLFVIPGNKVGIIDFGVVGRLSPKTREGISNMFVALAQEDYEEMAWEYVELTPHTEFVDVDLFAKDLRDLLSPYFGLSLKDVNLGRLLLESTRVAAQHKLRVPRELMLFFKSIVAVEGMGRILLKDFDLLSYFLTFAGEIVRHRFDPLKLGRESIRFGRDARQLLSGLPRQLRVILRHLSNPDHTRKIQLLELDNLRESLDSGAQLIFKGLVLGSLILGSFAALFLQSSSYVGGMPTPAFVGFLIAAIVGLLSFFGR